MIRLAGGGGGAQEFVVVTKLKGSGAGAYTTVSASYVAVDAVNLAKSLTTSIKQAIAIFASGEGINESDGDYTQVGLAKDGAVIAQVGMAGTSHTAIFPWSLNYSEPGDGSAHTWELQFFAFGGTANITNIANGRCPFFTILQLPTS
jgi:hypothetical protein